MRNQNNLTAQIKAIFIIPILCLMCSCGKDWIETPPSDPAPKFLLTHPYLAHLEVGYSKSFSNGSWEKYSGDTIINGRSFKIMINSDSNKYFYDSIGFAALQPHGKSIAIFDIQIKPLPDTMFFNEVYRDATIFFWQGYSHTFKFEYTLIDTTEIVTSFGNFSPCLVLTIKTSESVSGSTTSSISNGWYALGPSLIKSAVDAKDPVFMTGGYVNGKMWGYPSTHKLAKQPTPATDKIFLPVPNIY